MVLDQTWEQDLVRTYVLAAYVTTDHPRPPQAANSMEETAVGLAADNDRILSFRQVMNLML
jgi:hypothetical protein